jgi:hypothetical protein
LTVDGVGSLDNNGLNLELSSSNTGIIYDAQNGYHTFKRNGTNALQINGATGDVYFYDDTGSTQALFWDASAESLCLGNTSAGAKLDIRQDSGYAIRCEDGLGHYFRVASGGATEIGGNVDVTGTVTADGIVHTGDTDTYIKFLSNRIYSDVGGSRLLDLQPGTSELNSTGSVEFNTGASLLKRLNISSSGDISFYDDTGSTQGLFWDASAEGLWLQGYGTSTTPLGTPSAINDAGLYFANNSGNARWGLLPEESAGEDTLNLFADVSDAWQPVISFSRTTQNVGIGTSSPARELSIGDGTGSPNIQLLASTVGNSRIEFGDTDDSDAGEIQYVHSDNYMQFTTNGSEAMRLDSSGNVGIGTSSPSSNLHIKTSVDNSVAQGLVIERSANTDKGYINYNGGAFQFRSTVGDPIVFGETDSEHLRVAPDGNVGIGTSSPSNILHISASAPIIRLTDTDTSAYGLVSASATDGSLILEADAGNTVANSDMIFRVDGSEGMRIDSSGNVGIGQTSPSADLEIKRAGSSTIRLTNALDVQSANDIIGEIEFYSAENSSPNDSVRADITAINEDTLNNVALAFGTAANAGNVTERMRIDASGNVGIGTDSPQTIGGHTGVLTLFGSNATALVTKNSSSSSRIAQLGSDLAFFVNTIENERMRIDSSGNLLVGTTDIAPATNNIEGIALRNEGHINVSRASGVVGYFNRKTNDGEILNFRKDGTAVGSIGVFTTNAYFANGDVSLAVNGTYDVIHPRDGSGDRRSDAIDLGGTIDRFKDLYLSGGVYLGGTGAANKLDDYEEGTWTPATQGGTTGGFGSPTGTYIKIGQQVHAAFEFTTTGGVSGGLNYRIVDGLPFNMYQNDYVGMLGTVTPYNLGDYQAGGILQYVTTNSTEIFVFWNQTSTSGTLIRCLISYRSV